MPTLPTLKKDPAPGGPTTDGSTIFTDQHNAIVDIISGDSTDKIPESALAGITSLSQVSDIPTPVADQFLKRNAADTAYEWATPAGGGGGDASAWSTFAATQNVNLAGFALNNLLGFSFPILGQGMISHAAGFRYDLPATHVYTYYIDNNLMFDVQEIGASFRVPLFMNNNTISDLPTPALSHQAATKGYVDSLPTPGQSNFSDVAFSVFDDVDNTKVGKFAVDSITTGNTRTYTMPDKNGTLALLDDITAGSGPAFSDTDFEIFDNVDSTKRLSFSVGLIDTGTSRLLTVPNHNGIIITDEGAQSLSGAKTFTGGLTVNTNLNMATNRLENLDGFNSQFAGQGFSAVSTGFVWDLDVTQSYSWRVNGSLFFDVQESGVTSQVQMSVSNNKIINVADPTLAQDAATKNYVDTRTQSLIIPASGEDELLAASTGKTTFRMPYGFTLTEVRASVKTAPTGSAITVDINENGASVLSTPITIDATQKTSTTAAAPPVISDAALADDAEITIDIDAVGSTTPGNGLKVYLIGTKA